MPQKKKNTSQKLSNPKKQITKGDVWMFVFFVVAGCLLTGIIFLSTILKPVGEISATRTVITDNNTVGKYTITASYPTIHGLQNQFSQQLLNQQLNFTIRDQINAFKKEVSSSNISTGNTETITYSLEKLDSRIASVLFLVTKNIPNQAKAFVSAIPFVYDVQKNKLLTLDGVFVDNASVLFLSEYCATNLHAQYSKQQVNYDDYIKKGAGNDKNNFQKFVFSPLGIIFIFDAGTVAPFDKGVQQVTIPYSLLTGKIAQAYAK